MESAIEFPKTPSGHYFKLENFGRGWLALTLRRISTNESVIGRVIPRPNPSFINARVNFNSELDGETLHITQPKDVLATAHEILKEFEAVNRLSNDEKDYISNIEKIYNEEYFKNSIYLEYAHIFENNAEAEPLVKTIISELGETTGRNWLESANSHLNNARPIDALSYGNNHEVRDAFHAFQTGAF